MSLMSCFKRHFICEFILCLSMQFHRLLLFSIELNRIWIFFRTIWIKYNCLGNQKKGNEMPNNHPSTQIFLDTVLDMHRSKVVRRNKRAFLVPNKIRNQNYKIYNRAFWEQRFGKRVLVHMIVCADEVHSGSIAEILNCVMFHIK